MTKAARIAVLIFYGLGFSSAFHTMVRTWFDEPPPAYAYLLLIPPALVWPVIVTVEATGCAFQGSVKTKTDFCRERRQ